MISLERLPTRAAIEAELGRRARNKISLFYPDAGPLRRELYPKHLAFFRAGADHRERAAIAANRTGKTEGLGGYEITCHLTGEYPPWWEGRRFSTPIKSIAAGTTSKTVRDILQEKMLGPLSALGTGMIPGDRLIHTVRKPGVADAIELAYVHHVSGGNSVLNFKSYDQGREGFQGTEQHVVWMDEEPPMEIYGECLMRTSTVNGLVILTFTPLQGLTALVQSFLSGDKMPEGT